LFLKIPPSLPFIKGGAIYKERSYARPFKKKEGDSKNNFRDARYRVCGKAAQPRQIKARSDFIFMKNFT